MDSEIKGQFDMICQIKRQIHQTDLYLDRYLPVATLNLIKSAHEDSFGRRSDRKGFLNTMIEKFKELEDSILDAEDDDRINKDVLLHKCNLDKRFFEIPEITPLESLESEESEEEDDEDEVSEEEGEVQ